VAVGDEIHPADYIAEEWDGSSWRRLILGTAAQADSYLLGVSCPIEGTCMAVGGNQGNRNVVERLEDRRWSRSELPGVSSGNLTAVDCLSAARCLAVGGAYVSSSNAYPALAASWDGSSWTTTLIPVEQGYVGGFASLSCPSESLCVGLSNTNEPNAGYVWREK
jgi:hypothetical protein